MSFQTTPFLDSDRVLVLERLRNVRATLDAIDSNRRPELLAVSKTYPAEAVLAAAEGGQCAFGENYAQEGADKVDWFRAHHPELPLVWHFIGPLQSNKTRLVAEHFDWVQSVNREKIAKRLSEQRPLGLPPLNVLIEVNIDGEATKSGVMPEDVEALADAVATLPNLKLRGLMAIPTPGATPEARSKPLVAMRSLFDRFAPRFGWDTLSMGMSADMLEAAQAGSTMVRIGTAIFGPRRYPDKPS